MHGRYFSFFSQNISLHLAKSIDVCTYICAIFRKNLNATINQEELVDMLRRRDRKGFDLLYDSYSPALLGVIAQMITPRESAEDVLQDSFVKIWKYIERYDVSKGSLYTWMLNIVRNTALDALKSKAHKKQLQNQSIDNIVYNEKGSSEFSQPAASARLDLKDLLGILDKDNTLLISKAYLEGYTQAEIAEETGMPLGTVKTRMRGALQKLRTFFKEHE